MASSPLALPPALPAELLTYVLTYQSPIILIICQPRSTFLSSLLGSINSPQVQQNPDDDAGGDPTEQPSVPEPPKQHPLLIPTLRQVAASRYINLVFINTVSHFRAYLAGFPAPEKEHGAAETKSGDRPQGLRPLVVVYGLIGLHHDTSEWSAQGLGSSVAGLVEAGWRTRQRILVLEERLEDGGDGEEMPREVWEERLPMLNGNVRRAGLEGEDAVWSGRTVEVRRVLGRWFKFKKSGWIEK